MAFSDEALFQKCCQLWTVASSWDKILCNNFEVTIQSSGHFDKRLDSDLAASKLSMVLRIRDEIVVVAGKAYLMWASMGSLLSTLRGD